MNYKIGMTIQGKVTGIQPYGAFVSLDNNQQGLIHVSEVKHGFIKNISDELTVGDTVTVQVIDIDEYTKKISLSLRVLQETPPIVYRKKKYFTNKNKKIGFSSIEERLESWTTDALKETMEKN
ncbi:MAG: CvfD/Ygs/GSP13 family RNA-binding post-transcriptional regulator [Vagococcus sp.]